MATYTDKQVNLVINKMTQAQYDAAKEAGTLSEDEIYITPDTDTVPTKVSELENDVGYITASEIPANDKITDGTNTIKADRTFTTETKTTVPHQYAIVYAQTNGDEWNDYDGNPIELKLDESTTEGLWYWVNDNGEMLQIEDINGTWSSDFPTSDDEIYITCLTNALGDSVEINTTYGEATSGYVQADEGSGVRYKITIKDGETSSTTTKTLATTEYVDSQIATVLSTEY